MTSDLNTPAIVAIDLGAESCRVSLLQWIHAKPAMQLVHRFSNGPITENGSLRWDLRKICAGVEEGLRLCSSAASQPIASVGIDGWAVDYVRLGPDGLPLGNPYCYRDERTIEAEKSLHKLISPDRLYDLTGIQLLRLNTLYQLYADARNGAAPGPRWLNLPEFLTSYLGGKPVAEYTNATHTQLITLGKREWCTEIFDAAGLDVAAAPQLVPTGSHVGQMSALSNLPSFAATQLIVPACHDTASAIAGIPAEGDDWAFISSGTWSLVGTLLDAPCATAEARSRNFTNLGGAGGKICFLKNVNGMWLLRQCMDQWDAQGKHWTVDELIRACDDLPAPDHLLDVDDPDLMLPGNMPAKIDAQRDRAGIEPLAGDSSAIPTIANVIFHSLAARYAEVLTDIKSITGKQLRRIYIVGGGSRNALLNRLTAKKTELAVIPGAVESATIGNFAVQMASLHGDYSGSTGVAYSAVKHWASVFGSDAFSPFENTRIVPR
jgi:rhamnulokinase